MGLEVPSGQIESIDNPDDHIMFIRSQWADFAAFAWANFLKEGRGAVVIDLRNASKSGQNLSVPSYYVAESSERLSVRGGWPSEEIADVVRSYDPELDVVFIVLRLDGDCFHYNASDEPAPPDAYEKKNRGLVKDAS